MTERKTEGKRKKKSDLTRKRMTERQKERKNKKKMTEGRKE